MGKTAILVSYSIRTLLRIASRNKKVIGKVFSAIPNTISIFDKTITLITYANQDLLAGIYIQLTCIYHQTYLLNC